MVRRVQAQAVITPRPYQVEALKALDAHICNRDENPCVVIPTGGGKSILMAWAIQQWKKDCETFRVCVLAHRKELVKQNAEEFLSIWHEADVGVYSAGLGRRDMEHDILFASVDSVWKRWGEFPPFDCLIIDEAHRIPAKGEGKYRKFIDGCKLSNPNLIVVGFTATPFRMGCGPICHKTHILQKVCYEANVGDLIRDGFLCNLRTKVGGVQPNLENVRRTSGGDYITKSLAEAVDKGDVVYKAVKSAVGHLRTENRKSTIWFCVDVNHCHRVSQELLRYGIDAPVITAKTPSRERDRIVEWFKAGYYKHLINVVVFTEGFNAKRVDSIVDLAPTLSRGRFTQKVGRGLRLHPEKLDCLYLDYAQNIAEHGPIDCMDAGNVRLVDCGNCGDTFSMAVRVCPNCGWEIPKREVERAEAEDREKKMHEDEASRLEILGRQPQTLIVDGVTVHRHKKAGKPDSIKVQYRCGLSVYNEWICLDHGGYAEKDARKWWWRRFGLKAAKAITVNDALEDLFLAQSILRETKEIIVVRQGKYHKITNYVLNSTESGRGFLNGE